MSRATGRTPDSRRLHRARAPVGFDEHRDRVGDPDTGWTRRHTGNGARFWSRVAPGDERRDGYRKHDGCAGMGPALPKPPSAPSGVGPRKRTATGWHGQTGHPPRRRATDGARGGCTSAWKSPNTWSSNEVLGGERRNTGEKAQGLPPPLQEGGLRRFELGVKRRWSAWRLKHSPPPPKVGLTAKNSNYPDVAMGRRRDPGDLKAEVVEVGGCPSGCPRFKERIKWACT